MKNLVQETAEVASSASAITHVHCSVSQFIKADRQWPRRMRIAHAKYQAALATTGDERGFWHEVLKANTDQG